MNKFSERLANLGQTSPARLGFGRANQRDKTPVMLVIVESPGLDAVGSDVADAVLLTTPLDGPEREENGLWGAPATLAADEGLDKLKDKGCQFIIFDSDDQSAVLLNDEDVSMGLVIPAGATDARIRAVEDGPFEFLVYRPAELKFPLTLGSVLGLQEVVSAYSKHIVLALDAVPASDDLEVLKHLPVSALLVDSELFPVQKLKELRESIGKLEPRKQKRGRIPLVPAQGLDDAAVEPDDFDDDDDDDWED